MHLADRRRACFRRLALAAIGVAWLNAGLNAGLHGALAAGFGNALPYFAADPNVTGDLRPWARFQIGAASYRVSDHPKGMISTGSVSVAPDPLRSQGSVYKLSVTPSANFAAQSAGSDRVDLYNGLAPYMGQEGQETWEHVRLMFPSGREPYLAAPGDWNWLLQHHNDGNYKKFVTAHQIKWEYPELVWGMNARAKLPGGQPGPELFMRVWGGNDLRQGTPTTVYAGAALQHDHWYDMLVHAVWSHDRQAGLVEWWLDGKLLYSQHVANLWQRPDGSIDHVNFEFSNYRIHANWNSTVYYSRVKIGPTKASVSF